MTVTLFRHFKVIHARMRAYTPSEYRRALREYDDADVLRQDVVLPGRYQKVITSTLRRTSLTREILLGAAESQACELLNEVPLAPFTDRERRFDAVFLDVMARFQWLTNNPRQPETKRQTVERARAFVDGFLVNDLDYLLIGHGFFFRVLSAELLRRGFRGRPVRYLRNGQYEVYSRDNPGGPV